MELPPTASRPRGRATRTRRTPATQVNLVLSPEGFATARAAQAALAARYGHPVSMRATIDALIACGWPVLRAVLREGHQP